MTERPTLARWASDRYSQNGEDGMIAEVLRRLGLDDGVCVDVGAHDGLTYSNTAALWRDRGWRAVLIEPHPGRYRLLQQRATAACTTIDEPVEATGPRSLPSQLARVGITDCVDVLSIDIDGDDLAILRSLGELRARVVLCEYNPTIPWHHDVVGAPGTPTGCSLGTLVSTARDAGYALVGVTATNAVFVAAEDAPAFDDLETRLDRIALMDGYTWVLTDYRGRAVIVGALPFGYRPGRPALRAKGLRGDVALRWTAVGVVRTAWWKVGNVARRLRTTPVRDLGAEIRSRRRR